MTPEITDGAKVYLRGCPHGKPGTVVKIEHGRAVVYWHDLDFLARHKSESLLVVESGSAGDGGCIVRRRVVLFQKQLVLARAKRAWFRSENQAFAAASAKSFLEQRGMSR